MRVTIKSGGKVEIAAMDPGASFEAASSGIIRLLRLLVEKGKLPIGDVGPIETCKHAETETAGVPESVAERAGV